MTPLQKVLLEGKINRTLTRLEAQHHAAKPIWENMKPRHVLPYAYALIVSRQLGLGNLTHSDMLQRLPTLTPGLTDEEKFCLAEYLFHAAGTGFSDSLWLTSTVDFLETLPTKLRWGGERDPEEKLTVFRGVVVSSQDNAVTRIARPHWTTWRTHALFCSKFWLEAQEGETVLAKASIQVRNVYAFFNPNPFVQAQELVVDLRGLSDLEILPVTAAEIEKAEAELTTIYQALKGDHD